MNSKLSGFSLTEMLITLSLSLFLIVLLIKIYYWYSSVQHKIDDMVYLDHNGVLAMLILEDNIRRSSSIKMQNNKIILAKKSFFIHQTGVSNGLFYNEKNQRVSTELISGVSQLHVIWINKSTIKLKLQVTAPYGMKSMYVKFIEK